MYADNSADTFFHCIG